MLSNATNISYKPLKIQSDYSVSNIHKEIYTQSLQEELKKLGAVGSGYAEWYLPPQSYIHAHSYLTSNTANPLSFQNTLEQEQLLASKATNQMQDFLNTPNLANFKRNEVSLNNNDSKNTFGGYATDEYGFMGEEFLKVANLPSDYKIHKNVLQAFNDFYTISIYSNYKSIDLIAGISAANKEFNTLFTDDKPSYTKEEILQFTKESKEKFYEEDFNALLMQDYKNEKGEFKREGIMLMYAMKSDALENTPSPYTIKKEIQNNSTISKNSKEKTPEEKAKELKDALNDYYLKALEFSKTKDEDKKDSIPNSIAQEFHKDKIDELTIQRRLQELHDTSAGGEYIKVALNEIF